MPEKHKYGRSPLRQAAPGRYVPGSAFAPFLRSLTARSGTALSA